MKQKTLFPMSRNQIFSIFFFLYTCTFFSQTPEKLSSSEIYHELKKLNFIGSALYIAAHPDDENTGLISHLSNHVYANTAYLSLTRGDGGQNLIGPELREILGVIRTEELLEARKTDGGKQFFTRANDFGFSKNPDETFEFWDKDRILEDVVHIIRKFKPDVIINRFDHRSPGKTHGHHTASAILSVEAFDIVNNPKKFPKSAGEFGVWQPKRLFFNSSWFFFGSQEAFEKADKSAYMPIESGNFYPLLGLSNGEIAALSRSKHQSQGFGSTGVRGNQTEYLEFLKGDPITSDNLFEGINTNWSRLEGGEAIGKILIPLEKEFDFNNPSKILPGLLRAYSFVQNLKDEHWREIKTEQLKHLILQTSGLFLEAVSTENSINPSQEYEIKIETINRSKENIVLKSITDSNGKTLWNENENLSFNQVKNLSLSKISASGENSYSSPYWLKETGTPGMYSVPEKLIGFPEAPGPEKVIFNLQFDNVIIPVEREIVYKFNDAVSGEVYRPLEILPEVTTSFKEKVIIFPDNQSREVEVSIRAGKDQISGKLFLNAPDSWKIEPEYVEYDLKRKGKTENFIFTVTPSENQEEAFLKAKATIGNKEYDKELVSISYEHIPYKSVLLPSESKIVKLDLKKRGEKIGYIHGAGDAVPESLEQIGYSVTILDPSKISENNLGEFDAVVIGIRAYNTIPELAFASKTLKKYVQNGGTIIVQYNTNHALITDDFSPFPLELSRDRVTDEFSKVKFLAPKHQVLNFPNKITEKDFENWVQERGLYFPNNWSKEYTPVLGMNDKGESMTKGSLLISKYGKGYYIYTGLSFFRELPAGVPGAYRLFANMLSIGK